MLRKLVPTLIFTFLFCLSAQAAKPSCAEYLSNAKKSSSVEVLARVLSEPKRLRSQLGVLNSLTDVFPTNLREALYSHLPKNELPPKDKQLEYQDWLEILTQVRRQNRSHFSSNQLYLYAKALVLQGRIVKAMPYQGQITPRSSRHLDTLAKIMASQSIKSYGQPGVVRGNYHHDKEMANHYVSNFLGIQPNPVAQYLSPEQLPRYGFFYTPVPERQLYKNLTLESDKYGEFMVIYKDIQALRGKATITPFDSADAHYWSLAVPFREEFLDVILFAILVRRNTGRPLKSKQAIDLFFLRASEQHRSPMEGQVYSENLDLIEAFAFPDELYSDYYDPQESFPKGFKSFLKKRGIKLYLIKTHERSEKEWVEIKL